VTSRSSNFCPAEDSDRIFLTALVGEQIYEDMNCLAAWKMIPRGALVAMLDSVRNRVLDFVLEIESEAPDAGEAKPGTTPIPEEKVTQIFNTNIMGGSNIIAGSIEQVIQHHVLPGNLDSLRKYLSSLGVATDDVRELEAAIRQDEAPTDPKHFGATVSSWIGKMVTKAASGTWNVTTKAGGDLLWKALCLYYGLST